MIKLYRATELLFEKITNVATQLFANSIVFILAIVFVIYWLIDRDWHKIDKTDGVRDVILAVTFLSFFIIQRNFNHFSSALHLKVNELVSAHENARNHLIKVEDKSDEELRELSKEHDEIVEQVKKENEKPLD